MNLKEVTNKLALDLAGMLVPHLVIEINLSQGQIEKTDTLLTLKFPQLIFQSETKWRLTSTILQASVLECAERLTTLRRKEPKRIRDYVVCPFGKHLRFLIQKLDGNPRVVSFQIYRHCPKMLLNTSFEKQI